MVSSGGILHPDYLEHYGLVWNKYLNSNLNSSENATLESSLAFNSTQLNNKIQFVGLFDPVFSAFPLFVSNDFRKICENDQKLHSAIKHCVTLLSLDDERRHFQPMLIQSKSNDQFLDQVWMPGVHGDIGGTNHNNLFGQLALTTMLKSIRRYTNIGFDNQVISDNDNTFLNALQTNQRLIIGNDLKHFWRLDRFSKRDPTSTSYCKIHEITKYISNHYSNIDIQYKGKDGKYIKKYQRFLDTTDPKTYNYSFST